MSENIDQDRSYILHRLRTNFPAYSKCFNRSNRFLFLGRTSVTQVSSFWNNVNTRSTRCPCLRNFKSELPLDIAQLKTYRNDLIINCFRPFRKHFPNCETTRTFRANCLTRIFFVPLYFLMKNRFLPLITLVR